MTDERSEGSTIEIIVPVSAESSQLPTKPTAVSQEELAVAYEGPALLANKIYLTMTKAGARLAFTEVINSTKPPVFRSAVVLSYPDAIALKDLLIRRLKDLEGQLAALTPKPGSKDG